MRRWYEGRLSSVRRLTSNEVWATPRQAWLVGRPGLLVEVAPEPVRDVVVGEPLLGDLRVAVVQAGGLGLELVEEGDVVRGG